MTSFHFTVALCAESSVLLIGHENSLQPVSRRVLEPLSSPKRLKVAPWIRDARSKVTSAPYKRTLRDLRMGVARG
jgi:hypothetical protein